MICGSTYSNHFIPIVFIPFYHILCNAIAAELRGIEPKEIKYMYSNLGSNNKDISIPLISPKVFLLTFTSTQDRPDCFKKAIANTIKLIVKINRCTAVTWNKFNFLCIFQFIIRIINESMFF